MKKLLTILLLISLTLTSMSFVFAEGERKFSDIGPGHWAYTNVDRLVDLNVIGGYGDGTFRPNNSVLVDEFLKMTIFALGTSPPPSKTGYWAEGVITKAKEMKLIEENEFENTRRAIKREEMASVIVKALNLNEQVSQDNLKKVVQQSLQDYYLIDDYYKDAVLDAYKEGLIAGKTKTEAGSSFDPKGVATRAEAATVIMRLVDSSLRKPFDITHIPYTTATVYNFDEKSEIKYYAPINDRGEPVAEVITLHDEIKAIEGRDYGYHEITYNRIGQNIYTKFYPDTEVLKLPTFEKISHTDMSFNIQETDFKEGRYPYSLIIWPNQAHHQDLSTYYSYLEDRYGDFFNIYANILFEDEADIALELIEKMVNVTAKGVLQEEKVTLNNRNLYIVSNNGITIWTSNKLTN